MNNTLECQRCEAKVTLAQKTNNTLEVWCDCNSRSIKISSKKPEAWE